VTLGLRHKRRGTCAPGSPRKMAELPRKMARAGTSGTARLESTSVRTEAVVDEDPGQRSLVAPTSGCAAGLRASCGGAGVAAAARAPVRPR